VAEGEALGYAQADLKIGGHAIEARVCAENPAQDFLPAPGTVLVWEPAREDGVRYDSGVESGSKIGIEFDPMIAKVIAHAPTRREAAARLARALERTRIQGIVQPRLPGCRPAQRSFLAATPRPTSSSGSHRPRSANRRAPNWKSARWARAAWPGHAPPRPVQRTITGVIATRTCRRSS
jgi:hypothetical protein